MTDKTSNPAVGPNLSQEEQKSVEQDRLETPLGNQLEHKASNSTYQSTNSTLKDEEGSKKFAKEYDNDVETSIEDDDEEYGDEEDDDDEGLEEVPVGIQQSISNDIGVSKPPMNRRISKSDANSIVGGESLQDVYDEEPVEDGRLKKDGTRSGGYGGGRHPISDPHKSTEEQEKRAVSGQAKMSRPDRGVGPEPKVFSFSMPFGGLSNVRSNLFKQLQSFKIDSHIPLIGHSNNNSQSNYDLEQLRHEMDLKLERQQSISTVEDATYFRGVKSTDNVRFRAVKHSLSANLNEMLPDFIQNTKKNYESIYNEIDGNIVIMGGYRGSILRSAKTHKRLWIPLKAGFNLRKVDLLIGPTPEDELRAMDLIYPDGVLKNIGPIDICKKLIKKLDANPKTNVKEYGYDWRLSADILSKQLEEFLLDIYRTTGKPTLVIAHSMGGLIAHGALNRNPKLFRSLVYVGVPSECLNILGPIRFGDSVILNDKILTHETNFMMRSGFVFLPLSGRVFVNNETKEHYDLDYFNPDTWVEYNLSPLVSEKRKLLEEQKKEENLGLSSSTVSLESSGSIPIINSLSNKLKSYRTKSINRRFKPGSVDTEATAGSPKIQSPNESEPEEYSFSFTEAYNYLCDTLKRTKAYVLGLVYKEELEFEYPPLAMVYGNKVPSVRGSNVRSRQDIKDGNYYEFFYGHGDGVVHQKWLMPERKGFSFYDKETGLGQIVGKFPSDSGHVNLMTDFKAMGNALSAVFEAEKDWKERKNKARKNYEERKREKEKKDERVDEIKEESDAKEAEEAEPKKPENKGLDPTKAGSTMVSVPFSELD